MNNGGREASDEQEGTSFRDELARSMSPARPTEPDRDPPADAAENEE